MAFLSKIDFRFSISTAVIDSITGGDDSIVDELAAEAIEEMKSYLNERYDVVTVFSATGTARNKMIVMYCKDIALYHLYSIPTLMTIPDNRINRYSKALTWLKDVRDQKLNINGLTVNVANSLVKSGGNDRRESYQK